MDLGDNPAMYPGPIDILGSMWATWNLIFLFGTIAGYVVLRSTYATDHPVDSAPRFFLLRYIACVYVCALGAQWFAYAFDANSSLLPPPGFDPWRYYFHPLGGPKTLYGAVLLLPLAAGAFVVRTRMTWAGATDRSTPALFTILGFARIGCFLQGCCYGLRSDYFGVAFPTGSLAHADQFHLGLVQIDQSALPVLATQIPSAIACFALSLWSAKAIRRGQPDVFLRTVGAYSLFRLTVEFLRDDPSRNHLWGLSTSQWIALVILFALALRSMRVNEDSIPR